MKIEGGLYSKIPILQRTNTNDGVRQKLTKYLIDNKLIYKNTKKRDKTYILSLDTILLHNYI